jgi:hypothetical protein
MRSFYKLLPLFIVKYLAVKHCEKLNMNGKIYVQPFRDVIFEVK